MIARNRHEQGTSREEISILRWLLGSGVGALALVMAIGAMTAVLPRAADACFSTTPPMDCRRGASISKTTFNIVPPSGGGAFSTIHQVKVTTRSGKTSGNVCNSPSTVLADPVESLITLTVTHISGSPTIVATFPLPATGSGRQVNTHNVPINFPFGAPSGTYTVTGVTKIRFSADSAGNPASTFTALGDTIVCLVEEAPGMPGVARLALSLVDPGTPECGAGIQRTIGVNITNNDPVETVTLVLTVTSRQTARLNNNDPNDGFFSFSSPVSGDDFPIAFMEDTPANGVLPLPADPSTYTQGPIGKVVVLAPGQSIVKQIVSNSYAPCEDGSCSEFSFQAVGTFTDASEARACLGGAVLLIPATECLGADFVNACCAPDNSCTDELPEDCMAGGGIPLGAYSECTGDGPPDTTCVVPNPVPPASACCFEDGSCQDLDAITCQTPGSFGTPQGPGTTCSPNLCPTLGACCYPAGGDAQIQTAAICASGSGVYQGDGSTPAQVQCQVLLVELSEFDGEATADGVVLQWSTESEIDNEGFIVQRATSADGDYQAIGTHLIPALGGPAFGADYEFIDEDAEPGTTYYYLLDDIDTSGTIGTHGAGACMYGVEVGCGPVVVAVPGLSASAFCESHEIRSDGGKEKGKAGKKGKKGRHSDERACKDADWRDNEGRHPHDCTVAKDHGTRTCVARADAD